MENNKTNKGSRKKFFFSGLAPKKIFFLKLLNKFSDKMWPLSSRGVRGKALVAGPLKKELFCGFPKHSQIKLQNEHILTII